MKTAIKNLSLIILLLVFSFNVRAQWVVLNQNIIGAGVRDLLIYNEQLCALGSFNLPSNPSIKNVALWNGFSWNSLGTFFENTVTAGCVHEDILYVFVHNIGVYKLEGNTWVLLPNNPLELVNCLISYQGVFYAGGYRCPNASGFIEWNGSNWGSIGGLDIGLVDAFYLFNDKLYLAGSFTTAEDVRYYLAEWDGNTLKEFGPVCPAGGGICSSLINYFGDWYLGGNFGLGKWDGQDWNTGIINITDIDDFAIHNDTLYVCGGHSYYPNLGYVFKHYNSIWEDISMNVKNRVGNCEIFDDELIISGLFTQGKESTFNLIYKQKKIPFGLDEVINSNIKIYPIPFSDRIIVDRDNTEFDSYKIQLSDLNGTILFEFITEDNHFIINTLHLKRGVYFLRILSENKGIYSNKIIKI